MSDLNGSSKEFLKIFMELDKVTEDDRRINYKTLYCGLFNGITSILEGVADSETTTVEDISKRLKVLQALSEEHFINQ